MLRKGVLKHELKFSLFILSLSLLFFFSSFCFLQEPIFGRGALPNEQRRFQLINDDFRQIMKDIEKDDRVVSLCARADLKEKLPQMADQLSRCQKSLNEFLEQKRSIFPRFYFIGDDDLLEILGQATNPVVIQAHLKKLFAGIYAVGFTDDHAAIVEMRSQDGEVVRLAKPVAVTAHVEQWLGDLADEMKRTLEGLLSLCVRQVGVPLLIGYPVCLSFLVASLFPLFYPSFSSFYFLIRMPSFYIIIVDLIFAYIAASISPI